MRNQVSLGRGRAPRPAADLPRAEGGIPTADEVVRFPGLAPADPLTGAFAARLARLAQGGPRRGRWFIPSEHVLATVVDLPVRGRQRAAALAFAVEERLGAAVGDVVVAEAPLTDPAAGRHAVLALTVARAALAGAEEGAAGAALLPDFLAVPRPEAGPGGATWAVWRDGSRGVVRASDGTGFAVAVAALGPLWARAGRPALQSLGAALPAELPAVDLSANPPDADPRDLAVSLSRAPAGAAGLRPLRVAAVVAGLGIAGHLLLAAVDLVALGRIAAAERAAAQAALDATAAGLDLGLDPAVLLARLAPAAAPPRRSDFLPLLAEVSAALGGTDVGFRRLAFGPEGGLTLVVEAPGLDDLQAAERRLADAGFRVTSGAATAGDGGAEAEIAVARGDGA